MSVFCPTYNYTHFQRIFNLIIFHFSEWAAEYLYFASFELLDIFSEHGPCVRHYSFCFLLGPFSS